MSPTKIDLIIEYLDSSYHLMMSHLDNLSLDDALFVPDGGYRSILGTLKHAAAWSHVYRSYAFENNPKHWKDIEWPRGLIDKVHKSEEYLTEVIDWFALSHKLWVDNLCSLQDEDLYKLNSLHWGEKARLLDIVGMIARHHVYHAGEINQILSILRGEAWEEGEEVEENNIDTTGHRVKPPWLESY